LGGRSPPKAARVTLFWPGGPRRAAWGRWEKGDLKRGPGKKKKQGAGGTALPHWGCGRGGGGGGGGGNPRGGGLGGDLKGAERATQKGGPGGGDGPKLSRGGPRPQGTQPRVRVTAGTDRIGRKRLRRPKVRRSPETGHRGEKGGAPPWAGGGFEIFSGREAGQDPSVRKKNQHGQGGTRGAGGGLCLGGGGLGKTHKKKVGRGAGGVAGPKGRGGHR